MWFRANVSGIKKRKNKRLPVILIRAQVHEIFGWVERNWAATWRPRQGRGREAGTSLGSRAGGELLQVTRTGLQRSMWLRS